MERLLKTSNKGSQLMLEVDGKTYDVLIKEIDYDAMKNQVTEIDFQALVSNEKVHSVAEVVIHNQSKVVTGWNPAAEAGRDFLQGIACSTGRQSRDRRRVDEDW